jgi:hypothetical protein
MPDTSAHPLRDVLVKFWAPVPWLLEFAINQPLLTIALNFAGSEASPWKPTS